MTAFDGTALNARTPIFRVEDLRAD